MSDATKYLTRKWGPESAREYLPRMKKAWEKEATPAGKKMRYSVYFDATLAGFGEVLMIVGPLPLTNVRLKHDVAQGRYAMAFDADFQTWSNVLTAVKGCPVTRLNTYQNEIKDAEGRG